MKAGVAAMCAAAVRAADDLQGQVVITAVVDEEFESIGTRALVAAGVRADAAIVTEPTGLAIMPAHLGFVWADVTTFGRAAHGSRWELGVDAIRHAGYSPHRARSHRCRGPTAEVASASRTAVGARVVDRRRNGHVHLSRAMHHPDRTPHDPRREARRRRARAARSVQSRRGIPARFSRRGTRHVLAGTVGRRGGGSDRAGTLASHLRRRRRAARSPECRRGPTRRFSTPREFRRFASGRAISRSRIRRRNTFRSSRSSAPRRFSRRWPSAGVRRASRESAEPPGVRRSRARIVARIARRHHPSGAARAGAHSAVALAWTMGARSSRRAIPRPATS